MTTKLIENIDDDVWRKFVAISKYKNMKAGILLNELLFIFVEKERISKNGNKMFKEAKQK